MSRQLILLAAALAAAPAVAQPTSPPSRERYVEIAENERCPRSTDEEVVVCGVVRRDDQYRIPERLRGPARVDAVTFTERILEIQMAGDTGTMSCSNQGAGGFTGCGVDLVRQWREARDADRKERDKSTAK